MGLTTARTDPAMWGGGRRVKGPYKSTKILTGKYDPTLSSILHRNINSTRGNPLKLCTYRPKYDLCKYNFTVRVISIWNSLPTHVITAISVDSFKNRLDKFWANEEARFDYKANLSGSGFARCF